MEVLQTSALDHLATSPLIPSVAHYLRAVPVLLDGAEGEARTRTPLRAQRPQRCLSTNSNTSALPVGTGRSGGTRTPDLRFWRNPPGSLQHVNKGRFELRNVPRRAVVCPSMPPSWLSLKPSGYQVVEPGHPQLQRLMIHRRPPPSGDRSRGAGSGGAQNLVPVADPHAEALLTGHR